MPQVGGGTLRLPEDLAGSFGVVLVYRGAWCPYCNAQLAAFERAHDALRDEGIEVAAFSVDDEATSAALVEKRALRFRVGHSADADEVADSLGCLPQRGAALRAVHRLRPRPGRPHRHGRLLLGSHRAADARRRTRARPLSQAARLTSRTTAPPPPLNPIRRGGALAYPEEGQRS